MGIFKIITKPLGCLFSLIASIVIGVIGFIIIGIFALQYYTPSLVESQIESRTQFPATISENNTSLWNGKVGFNGLSIRNTVDYPTADFLDLKRFMADIDMQSVNKEELVIEELVLDVEKLSWVENKKGQTNLKQFAHLLQASMAKEKAPREKPPPEKKEPRKYRINKLVIAFNTVAIHRPDQEMKRYEVDYSKTFENVTNMKRVLFQVAKDLSSKGLSLFGANLVYNLLDKKQIEQLKENTESITDDLKQLGEEASEKSKETLDKAKDSIKDLF